MYIKMVAPVEVPEPLRRFTTEDWVLLDTMGSTPSYSCTGRFLTMHKRRRKRLTTRSLSQDHAILDDILHGQAQYMLNTCGKWGFNAFTLETVTGGRSLPVLCVHLFHWYGLLEHFRLDVVRVWKLFTLIEEGYHSTNPYHNSIHATDVTQAMHCFLQEEKIRNHLQPLEVMAALIGAVAHDLDHPGVNQHFLISTSNHLAVLYDNMSVLENHHWRSAVGCLLESGVAEQLTPCRNDLESQIRSLILATDINRQQEFLGRFKKHLDEGSLDLRKPDHRHFILQIALKCADISNPTRPWDISHRWSLKVCDEFFRQGEYERKLNLPVTSICDQQSTSVAKIQSGFFRYVVTPLYSEWHRFLKSTLSTCMMNLLERNRKKWEAQELAEQAEETQTELSDAEAEQEISEEEELSKAVSDAPTIIDFISPLTTATREIRRQSLAVPTLEGALGVRRHSVPVNMEQPPLPRTIYRRESLPTSRRAPTPSTRTTVSPVPSDSHTSSDYLREEDELMKFGSQSSLLSSSSGGRPRSSEDQERPLSAENLLPETNIASMTSSIAASRLSSVLYGTTTKALTRQQTFPPPQPYVRMRYMSATAEMSTCPEMAHESGSNSSHSSQENISNVPQYTIPSIAVLSPSNSKGPEFLITDIAPSRSSNGSGKREQESSEKEKAFKIPKLSESERFEKENVDPRRLLANNLARRRGSAPVTVNPDNLLPAGGVFSDLQGLRRGSVPVEITTHRFDEATDINAQRRGSAPTTDLPRLHLLTRHISLNGKTGRHKKQLHRRLSGGPETVCLSEISTESCSRHVLLRQQGNSDVLLAQRRGSLPIEVLTVGHSVC